MDIARSHVATKSTKEKEHEDDTETHETNPKAVVEARKAHDNGETEQAEKVAKEGDNEE